jgi:hypothetical protein
MNRWGIGGRSRHGEFSEVIAAAENKVEAG